MDIGKRLKEIRKSKTITITALSKKIGLTREYLSNIERNINTPSLQTLQKICDALGITLAEFFSEEERQIPPEISSLMKEVKNLTPEQAELLARFIQTMKDQKGE
ncbi:helix-turn-helix domain-containing protein [Thermoanaerobacterium sp. DL9XJH110]|uniref:helix-turn-helix domain-containing protein n=1 Tax=Thermoanaerobacterium sp. DL9XJH110 TaxID=3386643 RepID=UPI003BB51914